MDVPTGLRLLLDRARALPAIDTGTNSVKFHVAEVDTGGTDDGGPSLIGRP